MKFRYYFSVTSPFCYVGNQRIFSMEQDFGIKWELKPFVIGRDENDSPPDPLEVKHMRKDIERVTSFYNFPLKFPKGPPKSSLAGECFFIADDAGRGREYIEAMNRAFWGEGRDIGDMEVISDIVKAIGIDSEELTSQVQSPLLKKRLAESTAQGKEDGVFGVPTLVIENEVFWGQDRLDIVKWHLEKILNK